MTVWQAAVLRHELLKLCQRFVGVTDDNFKGNPWLLQVFMDGLHCKWEWNVGSARSWVEGFGEGGDCMCSRKGRRLYCATWEESDRQVFTVTSKDLQPLANASQMYSGTRHTSQVSPCDGYSVWTPTLTPFTASHW